MKENGESRRSIKSGPECVPFPSADFLHNLPQEKKQ
jgi:hypothetical protein